jgi:hypothetical protein
MDIKFLNIFWQLTTHVLNSKKVTPNPMMLRTEIFSRGLKSRHFAMPLHGELLQVGPDKLRGRGNDDVVHKAMG